MHLQVLPRLQGRGIGTALLDRWRRRGFSDLATPPSRAPVWPGRG